MSILQTRAALDATVLIDQFRQDNMAIQSFLNVDAKRKELAGLLTDYYARQGVTDVTPEMIEAGVALLERDRFTYKGFSGGALAKSVAKAYLTVNDNARSIGIGLIAALAIGLTVSTATSRLEAGRYSNLLTSITEQRQQYGSNSAKIKRFIDDQNAWLVSVKNDQPTWAVDVTQATLAQFRNQLENVSTKLYSMVAVMDDGTEKPTLDAVKKNYDVYQAQLNELSVKLGPLQESLQKDINALIKSRQSLESLWAADKALSDLMSTQAYQAYATDPQVQLRQAAARSALIAGEAAESTKSLAELKVTLTKRSKAQALVNGVSALTSEFSSGFKDSEGQRKFNLLASQARQAAEDGNEGNYRQASTAMRALWQYVGMDLTVRVVDGKGKQSGVGDRCQNVAGTTNVCADGPKRNYVILESVDASGRVVPREVYNWETKTSSVVESWAQEVSRETYDEIKKSKVQNGFVEKRDFGHKAPGDYALTYDRSVLNGTITSWGGK
ncbi:DUF6384 family protein [Pseudomonas serbica]|uniref:DUF6384 family protein n=1 Tax=Pseudomonas serbica TaxID=2965074 RepID=UPI00237BF0AC|nr:DUF6384 family protein [Pseudomonas serbica]